MKFLRGTLIGLFCLAAGFLVVCQPWTTQAQAAAPATGKPALYDFGRGMCVPCMEMEKILGSVKGKYGSQIEVRMIMAEKDDGMFKEYKIMLIPTQVFLDASGKEVFRHVGLYPENELVDKLKELNFIKK
ncbi:MAG: thioredoxin family protein [Desulfobaccales bacterium]